MERIKLYIGSAEIPVLFISFPGGESHVTIPPEIKNPWERCSISALIASPEDIMKLLLLTNAARELWGDIDISLLLPYVPYGRQDRVANQGEAFSLKVFAGLINSQKYDCVEIHDPHSDVTPALIDRCYIIGQEEFVKDIRLDRNDTILVSPDSGASKKALKVAQVCGFSEVIQALKIRDTKTGKITETKVLIGASAIGKDFLIVDDICDGGRTFIELAKILKKYTDGDIYLYVTHGIFSKGLRPLLKDIKHIYTSNSFADAVNDDYITIVNQRR